MPCDPSFFLCFGATRTGIAQGQLPALRSGISTDSAQGTTRGPGPAQLSSHAPWLYHAASELWKHVLWSPSGGAVPEAAVLR